jgi:phenylpropionate dioxygenase-like ring-hydroxylating dioxygenase large terminal subunit
MFLTNAWYVAALAREVSRQPLARTILGQPLVLFRTEAGTPVALSDRCPHRGAQLAKGSLEGDALVCGYHGFTFDGTGRCIRIPGMARVPEQINVRHYPIVEAWNWLFVWMGDPRLAADAKLPDYHWMSEPGWAGRDELLPVKANYTLVRDNLLDLSHAKFVHRNTLATDEVTETPANATSEDDMVKVLRDMRGIAPSPFFKRLCGFGGRVDHSQLIEFTPPCHIVIKVRVASVAGSGEDKVADMRVLNAMTPETERSTLYFWGLVRNFAPDDQAATDLQHKLNRDTFFEDVDVLEAQQQLLDCKPAGWLPVNVPADRGCVLAERLMTQLIDAERMVAAPSERIGAAHV